MLIRYGSMTQRGAHMCRLVSPLRAPLLLPKVVCNVHVALSNLTQHLFCIDIWWTSSPEYEAHVFNAHSQSRAEVKTVRVSRKMDCRLSVIKSHVSDNNKNVSVSWLMCHVYKFMCYSFVELKLKINSRSLFNRTLNRAHPPLLYCALLALRGIQLMTGEPRPRYNALQLLGVSGACGLTIFFPSARSIVLVPYAGVALTDISTTHLYKANKTKHSSVENEGQMGLLISKRVNIYFAVF